MKKRKIIRTAKKLRKKLLAVYFVYFKYEDIQREEIVKVLRFFRDITIPEEKIDINLFFVGDTVIGLMKDEELVEYYLGMMFDFDEGVIYGGHWDGDRRGDSVLKHIDDVQRYEIDCSAIYTIHLSLIHI